MRRLGWMVFPMSKSSHLFDRVDEAKVCRGPASARTERLAADRDFGTAPKIVRNRFGRTVCRLLSVSGFDLSVAGLDAIDGTPVLMKPYLAEFGPRGELRQPAWSTELGAGLLGVQVEAVVGHGEAIRSGG